MRLATFNLENMFERPIIMNLPSTQKGRQVLADYYHLSDLIQKQQYSQNDKDTILKIMKQYRGLLKTGDSEFIRLIESRGHLTDSKHTKIQANGRVDWIGWFELKREAVKEIATENTGLIVNRISISFLYSQIILMMFSFFTDHSSTQKSYEVSLIPESFEGRFSYSL